jgi:hypothetical protein
MEPQRAAWTYTPALDAARPLRAAGMTVSPQPVAALGQGRRRGCAVRSNAAGVVSARRLAGASAAQLRLMICCGEPVP